MLKSFACVLKGNRLGRIKKIYFYFIHTCKDHYEMVFIVVTMHYYLISKKRKKDITWCNLECVNSHNSQTVQIYDAPL